MPDDTLRKAAEMLRAVKEGQQSSKAQVEKERRDLILGVGREISDSIKPMLSELVAQGKTSRQDMLDAVSQIQIDVTTPDVIVPEIRVPEPRVSVSVPPIRVPDINMPDEMNIKGWVSLMGVDLNNPLPVQLRDASGKPLNLLENLTTLVAGGGGGGRGIVKVSGLISSALADYINADNRLRVSVETGGSGLTDSELRASAVPTIQASGAIDSVFITGASGTLAANIVDSTGVGYSGSNPLPITIASGALTSTVVVGSVVADVADDGSAPLKIGGIARTANPTAVAGGDTVSSTHDDLGRQITRPLQVRDLMATAYVSLTTGTETTLLAAGAGTYLDLVYLMGTNNSDAAVTVDIRGITGGNIVTSIRIPANGTAGVSLPVPIPQDETGNTWSCDLPDITGTTVTVSALFSKEI
jgi:hypothetical protein